MAPVTVRAPAKVNLALAVGAPSGDGFHPLATVYQAVSVYDDVRAVAAEPGEFSVRVTGADSDDVPTDERNLAVRAARMLAQRHDVKGAGAALHIHKSVPVAGGMAGGSADAAAALVACDALWGVQAPRSGLLELAAELGSDVPFCLVGGTAVGSGRGEQVTPVLGRGSYSWVIAYAERGLPTPQVYAELDRIRAGRAVPLPVVPGQLMNALRNGNARALGDALCNDLQAAALELRPELARILDVGDAAGALASLVSGSGPTTLFLARDDEHASDVATALSSAGVCRLAQRVTGPVPGARVIR